MLVQALRTNVEMISEFGGIVNVCRGLISELPNISVLFVKRSANRVAHEFARASLLYPDHSFSMGDVPSELLSTLVLECLL